MRLKLTTLVLAASAISMNAQVLFQEDFTSPFNPTASGWALQNNSVPTTTNTWFQGNPANFTSFNGAPGDYYTATWGSAGAQTANDVISNWLITPTLNLQNGYVFEFASRTFTNPAQFPDRLEVYLSTAGAGTNVGTTSGSLGTFSTLIVSINPNLTTTGYPGAWTIYSTTLTGLPSGVTLGRAGFRYHVTNLAANSNVIGIDAVRYLAPCEQPTLTITQSVNGLCSGSSVSLTANTTGTVTAASYTWSTGQQVASIVESPTVTTIYTVSATSPSGCVGTATAIVTVTASPVVQVPSFTACSSPAPNLTITATGASTYSWNTGATTNSIVVSPNATTSYTVTGYDASGVCSNTNVSTVTLGSQLAVNVVASSTNICSGRVATLTANSAGTTYSWSSGQTVPTITVSPSTTTTYSVGALYGTIPNVCVGGTVITISVSPSPTLSISQTPSNVCAGQSLTITTSGANTYTYLLSPTQGTTVNPLTLTANNVTTLTTAGFTVGGTGSNGCLSVGLYTLQINPNPTVAVSSSTSNACTNSTISITASGADSYVWTGAATGTSNPLVHNTGATAGVQNFSVVGTSSAGCTGTASAANVAVTVSVCSTGTTVGIASVGSADGFGVYPNPFVNEIVVSQLQGHVTIYNAIGQVVITGPVNGSEVFKTTDLPKGVYTVQAYNYNNELVRTTRLIKN